MEKKQEETFSNDWSTSPIMNISVKSQVGIVGTFIGVPALAAIDAMIGLDAWMVLPEAAGIAALLFGATYMMKRQGFDLKKHVKGLNWGALLGDQAGTKDAPDADQESDAPVAPGQDRLVNLAPDLHIDIDDIAGKATFICGIRRSGKTTLGVRVAEELGKFNIPMFIPDLKGDWLSCVKTLPNAVILGQGQATEKSAKALGYTICEERLQIILDITSFDDMNEAALVIAGMIAGIFLWERKHPESRSLCAVFLDEAQSFLPQNVSDSIIPDAVARDAMLNAYMRAIAIGGSLGLFPVILTQRIAQTNNKVIGQPELLFLFKQTMDNDLTRYKNFTSFSPEQVRALGQGQGIYVSYEGKSSIHLFHKRTSNDAMSATPKYKATVLSPSPKSRTQNNFELEDLYLDEEVKASENGVKQPVRPSENDVKESESLTTFTEAFTTDQEQQIILAALSIAQTGQKVTRDAIKLKLGWNNKQYDVLKAVCDKHSLGGN
jgi:hypothetical protein